jgi:hypothetical protein
LVSNERDLIVKNYQLEINNGNSGNVYTLGGNASDLVIASGNDKLLLTTTGNEINLDATDGDINITCNTNTGAGAINLTAGSNNSGTNVITLNAPYGNVDITSGAEINLDNSSGSNPINITTANTLNVNCGGGILMTVGTDIIMNGALNGTNITLDDATATISATAGAIELDSQGGSTKLGDVSSGTNGTRIELDDLTGAILLSTSIGSIEIDSKGSYTSLGDVNGDVNGTRMEINDANEKVTITAGTGVKLVSSTIQYPCNFYQANLTLDDRSTYVNTFFGAGLVATLPVVTGTNVGTQYLITNTSAGNMSVTASGGQLIYSSTGAASAPSKTLNTGHSHIFTAIYTIDASTYGWSMV